MGTTKNKKEETNALGQTFSEAVEASEKNKVITLNDFNINALAEIQGKKEALEKIVEENPYVEIMDSQTYETAKRRRTTLRTARTDTEKEEKALLAGVKSVIVDGIKGVYSDFKQIVTPKEDSQQAEVTRWEEIKQKEKEERDRIEEERKENHRTAINLFFELNKGAIENLDYEAAKTFELEPKINGEVISSEYFEEFQDAFQGKLEVLKVQLNDKKKHLQEAENIRIEREQFDLKVKRTQELISFGFSFDGNNYFVSDFKRLDIGTILRLSDHDFEEIVKAGIAELDRLKSVEDAKQENTERIESIKKAIDNFFNYWVGSISVLKFEDIASFKEKFESQKHLDCQEFQPLYDEKRAELVKQIEARVAFLNDQEELRKDKEMVLEQKKQNLIVSRTNELISIGFDKDGAYDTEALKIIVSEDDLLADEEEWESFIDDTKLAIENSKIVIEPVTEPEIIPAENIEVVQPENVSGNQEPDNIMDVDFEEENPLLQLLLKAKKTICSLKLSMLAHPDCEEGSEFDDFTSLAQDTEDEIDDYIKTL